jgi:UV DNA damage endonuclease
LNILARKRTLVKKMVPCNFNLGYACLNTELRKGKPPVFTSRTCRLDTYKKNGLVYVKELALKNLSDLLKLLKWNVEHNIYFMRLSSEIFPFASHKEFGYSIDFADTLLSQIGDYAKRNKIRLTMHPGQYDVLSSPKEEIIQNTILDLNHHCDILDKMGLDSGSVMIIHGGGVYGDKGKALERLEKNILRLPERSRNRLVLENCEMSYCVEDLLPISEKLLIPIVLDFHHDQIYPSSKKIEFYFDRVFEVWNKRGIKPKVHVSNSLPGITDTDSKTARRKHSDFIEYFHDSLLMIKFDIDVMLECKMKEQGILKLRDRD